MVSWWIEELSGLGTDPKARALEGPCRRAWPQADAGDDGARPAGPARGREGGGPGAGDSGHLERFQHLPAACAVIEQAGEVKGEPDIVEHAQRVEEMKALEQQPDAASPEPVPRRWEQVREVLTGYANTPCPRGRRSRQQMPAGCSCPTPMGRRRGKRSPSSIR